MLTPFTLFAFITLHTQFLEVNKINFRSHSLLGDLLACDRFFLCVDAAYFLLSHSSIAYYYHNNILKAEPNYCDFGSLIEYFRRRIFSSITSETKLRNALKSKPQTKRNLCRTMQRNSDLRLCSLIFDSESGIR